MAVIDDILRRLFTTKVVLKKLPGGRLKTIDLNKIQTINNTINDVTNQGIYSKTNSYYNLFGFSAASGVVRNTLYSDYELMDTDALISAALDAYSDESTATDAQGEILSIETDDEKIKKVLYNLYHDILNIDFNLWYWVRSLVKYGDFFLYLKEQTGVGITEVVPIHPALMNRVENFDDSGEVMFEMQASSDTYTTYRFNKSKFFYHEIAHFRILSDTNYLPYGRSLLEGGRKDFKKLILLEDAVLIHRIMRAPDRRLFKIDVGNIPPESVDSYMESITNRMQKVPYIDPQTGDYNLNFNLMSSLEDYYIPVRGSDSGTSIESLSGLSSENALNDLEYVKNKILSYLRIPKAYLGNDEGTGSKSVLAAEDIKFARFIERIQKLVVAELEKIGYIHLYLQGFSEQSLLNFKLSLATPSLIYERQKIDLMSEKINMVNNIIDKNLFSKKYIYENIFGLTEKEWQHEQDLILEDIARTYREEQIKNEGNDPVITGKSFGTAHDLALLYMKKKEENDLIDTNNGQETDIKDLTAVDKRSDNNGRPKKFGSFERQKDPSSGIDPTGRKDLQSPLNAGHDKKISFLFKNVDLIAEKKDEIDEIINKFKFLNETNEEE